MTAQKDGYVLKLVPRYAVFSLVFAFLWNSLIYNGAIALQRGRPALDMTTALEDAIPFQPPLRGGADRDRGEGRLPDAVGAGAGPGSPP